MFGSRERYRSGYNGADSKSDGQGNLAHGFESHPRLEADVFPVIGRKPVTELTAPMLIMVIRKIEACGALDIAKHVLTICGQVFRYAVVHGLAERNPAADIKPSDVLKGYVTVNC